MFQDSSVNLPGMYLNFRGHWSSFNGSHIFKRMTNLDKQNSIKRLMIPEHNGITLMIRMESVMRRQLTSG